MKKYILAILMVLSLAGNGWPATYYISTSGSDTNNGTSKETPWKTPFKINSTTFTAGDSILFKRGDTWIGADTGPIIPSTDGTAIAPITWGAYGTGNRPVITYASRRSSESDWTNEGGNIWSTGKGLETTGSELFPNPGFEANDLGWYCDGASGGGTLTASRTTTAGEFDSGVAGYKIAVTDHGTTAFGVYLRTTPGYHPAYEAGKYYIMSFRAKATTGFTIPGIVWGTTSDDLAYGLNGTVGAFPTITTDWATYYVIIRPLRTLVNPAIRFYLGGADGIPDGETFYLDTMSIKETSEPDYFGMYYSANIIFNSNTNKISAGKQIAPSGPIVSQGEWYQSAVTRKVYIYSVENPASIYSDILIVNGGLRTGFDNKYIGVDGKDHQIVENIEFFACGDAFYAQYFTGLTVRNCKATWNGGRLSYSYADYDWGGSYHARFGAAVGVGGDINGFYVYNNEFYENYDVNITWQSTDTNLTQENIWVYNNVLGPSEYGVELWLRDNSCTLKDVYVYNNTFYGMGKHWGANQRPDGQQYTSAITFQNSTATTSNINVKNNIFYDTDVGAIIRIAHFDQWDAALTMDYNLYYGIPLGGSFAIVAYELAGSPFATFEDWQTASGKDANSLYADPRLGRCFLSKIKTL
ncbi:MAG: hypothetical protein ABIJ31_00010 [Pseudomonadota bacterium]